MASIRAFLIPAAAILAPVHAAVADPSTVLPDGAYEIVSRLELPYVERWAVDKTTRSCLSNASNAGDLPIPVVSANNPFANCAAANLAVSGASVEYDIVCPGRASAKAHASYMTTQDGFSGRVAMVMAAKNMTMTEVVRAHRLGECDANGHQASDDPRPLATGR